MPEDRDEETELDSFMILTLLASIWSFQTPWPWFTDAAVLIVWLIVGVELATIGRPEE